MMKLLFVLTALCSSTFLLAQKKEQPFINLVNGTKDQNRVSTAKQFLTGSTCRECTLSINGESIKVYSSGGFAYELRLPVGDTSVVLTATLGKKSISKKFAFTYQPSEPPGPVSNLQIESIETFPAGNLVLQAGDKITFVVKTLPQCKVTVMDNTALYEQPLGNGNTMPGIYKGSYTVKASDSFMRMHIPVRVDSSGQVITRETRASFSVMSPLASNIAQTKGRLAHLEYGLGADRLGGAKIGYIDSLVLLRIIGKVDNKFKVQLAPSLTAYIPDDVVTLLPKGSPEPQSLTGAWSVSGDNEYDYVSIALQNRLPYQSRQTLNPSGIEVDIYGATNNTNWITQLNSAKEIVNVDYEQVADDIFRVKIQLKHAQHWGHQIYYRGNSLQIKIKQQPRDLSLHKLTIAVDAGHGGSNAGASGPTGSSERHLALAVALKLQKALEAQGAKVIMTRTKEMTFDNKERILFYRDSMPHLLISIHLNSSSNPIAAGGTSTHYRYPGFKKLNEFINSRMMELGLRQYGVISSFNFMLNSPTEYPNSLVETLFISNPAEEAMMLNEDFQEQMAQKILLGIQDFLSAVN